MCISKKSRRFVAREAVKEAKKTLEALRSRLRRTKDTGEHYNKFTARVSFDTHLHTLIDNAGQHLDVAIQNINLLSHDGKKGGD